MPVYQYEGQHYDLPDGLSNEQAISKIKAHLGTQKAEEQTTNIGKSIVGGLEAGMSTLAGLPSTIVGGLAGAGKLLTGGSLTEANDALSNIQKWNFGAGAYEPYTDKGKQYAQGVGQALEYPVHKAGDVGAYLGGDIGRLTGEVGMGTLMALVDPLIAGKAAKGMITRAGKSIAPKIEAIKHGDSLLQDITTEKPPVAEAPPPAPPSPTTRYTQLQQEKQQLLGKTTKEAKARLKEIEPELLALNEQLMQQRAREQMLAEQSMFGANPKEPGYRPTADEIANQEALNRQSQYEQAHPQEQVPVAPDHPGQLELPFTDNPVEGMAKRNIEQRVLEDGQLDLFEHKQPDVISPEILKRQEMERAFAERPQTDEAIVKRWDEEHAAQDKQQSLLNLEDTLRVEKEQGTGQGPKTRAAKQEEMRAKFGKGQTGGINLSWNDKKKQEFLKGNPGLKHAVTDVGNAMISSPDEAIRLTEGHPDVSQGMLGKAFNWFTKGPMYLKGRVDNPVVHFTVDRVFDAQDMAAADVSSKIRGDYIKKMQALSKDEYTSVATLLSAADLHQKTITPAMMDAHNLSPKMREAIDTHNKYMAESLEIINKARATMGKEPITAREAYSPMSIRGDFRKPIYKTVDGKREVVGVIGSDFLSGKVGWTLEKIENYIKEKHPDYEIGPLQDRSKAGNYTHDTPHEAFNDVLQTLGDTNPNIKEFLDVLRDMAKEDTKHYMGMDKHMLQKKGVFGSEGRKPWLSEAENAAQFFDSQTKYLENVMTWGHLSEAAKDVNAVLTDPKVMTTQKNAVAMSENILQKALGVNGEALGKALNSVMNSAFRLGDMGPSVPRNTIKLAKTAINTWLLSASHVFLGMQMLQAPMGIPAMASFLRARGLATPSTWLSQGLGHFVEGQYTLLKQVSGMKLNEFEKAQLAYAKKKHVYADDMVEHSMATQKDKGYYFKHVTQAPISYVEKGTRAQVYMAISNMMRDAGMKIEDGLFEQAHRFTDQVMSRNTSLEKPRLYEALGPIGSAAYHLSSFKHNELSRYGMYANEVMKSKNPFPILIQMATTMAMAGVMGLPFFSLASKIYEEITTALGEPKSLILDVQHMSEQVGKDLGGLGKYVISNGLPTLLGFDPSKRMGMGDIVPSSVVDAAFPGASKLGSMATSVTKAAIHPTKGEYAESALYNVAPAFAQGPLDVALFQDGDLAMSKDPDALKSKVRRTDKDVLMRKLGLMGINESAENAKNFELSKIDKAYTDIRHTALNGMAQDLRRGRDLGENITKYIRAQGDANSLDRDITAIAQKISLSQSEQALLKDAASKSMTRQQSLQRRLQ